MMNGEMRAGGGDGWRAGLRFLSCAPFPVAHLRRRGCVPLYRFVSCRLSFIRRFHIVSAAVAGHVMGGRGRRPVSLRGGLAVPARFYFAFPGRFSSRSVSVARFAFLPVGLRAGLVRRFC